MALFCVDTGRNSVSHPKFPFRSHAQVFSCEISSVCRLEYPYSCFSSHFCFLCIVIMLIFFMLSVLFLVAYFSALLLISYNSSSGIYSRPRGSQDYINSIFVCLFWVLFLSTFSPVGWSYRIQRMHLCKVVRPPPPQRVSCL